MKCKRFTSLQDEPLQVLILQEHTPKITNMALASLHPPDTYIRRSINMHPSRSIDAAIDHKCGVNAWGTRVLAGFECKLGAVHMCRDPFWEADLASRLVEKALYHD